MATALSAQLARKGPAKLALRGAACLSPLIKKTRPTDPSRYRAIRRQEAAGIDGLTAETLERSALSKGQVRIGVRSAGLNFRDVLSTIGMLEGERQKLGVECAGEVIEVASGVTAFKPGDRVFGYAPGALAEEVVVPVEWLELTPDHLTDDEAGGLCVAFGTALYGLDHIAKLKPGERVLIHAGAGGVGLAAIQIALARGAEVFTTAGSEQKRDMLRRLGVHHIFDSRTLDFEKQVCEATRGAGVDVVLNSLAGDFIPASVRTLSANGRFLELGKRDLLSPDAFFVVRPGASYHVYDLGRDIEAHPAILKPLLADILTGIEEEKLSPLPTHVFGLAHIAHAMRFMASAKHIGKIILRVPPRSHAEIRANATYWVTGGLGGLGLHTARWLVGKGARHIVLSGRRGPDASASAAIAQIEKAGATVRILVGDAGDSSSNAQILALIKNTMAPLRGIIHAAGSLRDGPVLTRRPADVESVFRGKLAGALSLDQSTRHLPLDFFILYSAAGTTLGAPGQSLYAAANAALDALAAKRVWAGYPATSIAWGRWSGIGMLAELAAGGRDVWAERGLGSITPESGFAQLEDMLRSGLPNAMAIAIDWRTFAAAAPQALDMSPFARFSKNHPNASAEPAGSLVQTLGEKLTIAPPGERHDKLQQCVETAARDIIGLPADTDIDPDQPLKDIGLDSLMAVEMRNELARAIGLRLTATLLFDYPTVNRLVEHLDVQLSPDRSEKPGETVPQEDDLDSLSDQELAALLDEELAASAVRQNTRGEPPK
jgi:NADPH:quinone reductase-like Zn-dependent oxidoreductase/acyl carrier protein